MRSLILLLTSTLALAAQDKPNIVFFLVDDLGRNDLGMHGSTFHETPRIDALAKESLVFENAYAAHPRCVGSRYGILSGRIPARDGVPGYQDWSLGKHNLPLQRDTFGEHLQKAGYHTSYIGKWHLGKEGGEPDKQGFADSRIAGPAGAPPSYFQPYHIGHGKEKFAAIEGPEGEYLTDRLTDEAIDFLENRPKEKPFLLVLAHYAVHTPFQAPQDLIDKYTNKFKEQNIPIGGKSDDADLVTTGNGTDKTVQNNPIYAAMLESTDTSVGRVLDALDKLDLAENTLIVLTSDHGTLSTRAASNKRPLASTNLPYRHGKGWLYDGGLRVPHLVRWPAKIKPAKENRATHGTDHYASFLTAAGVTVPAEIDGQNYLPEVGPLPADDRPLFFHSPQSRPFSTGDEDASALIVGHWKLVQHHKPERYELFNLSEDPAEKNDLSASHPEQLARLTEQIKTLKTEINAQQGGRNPFAEKKK